MRHDVGYGVDVTTGITTHRSRLSRWTHAAVLLAAVGAVFLTVCYRTVYNTWPGQSASGRVHWCGRDYEYQGPPETRQQASSQGKALLQAEGAYPPLAWTRDELFAVVNPTGQHPSTSCTTVLFLHTGPDTYAPYALEGGP
jgi:hypothetical protein